MDNKEIIYIDTLIIYTLVPSDLNFKTILMPKVILATICHKKLLLSYILNLSAL